MSVVGFLSHVKGVMNNTELTSSLVNIVKVV